MASAYLKRDISATGNQKKWTFSAWIKISALSSSHDKFIFSANNEHSGGGNYSSLMLNNDLQLRYYNYSGGSVDNQLITTRNLRDANGWYHILVHYDSANSTADDRIKFYINGSQETDMNTRLNPSQNYNSYIENNYRFFIGTQTDSTSSNSDYDGSMTHVHFANDQLYAPTVFAETDATTGIWKPKTSPSVTYGTNGIFLKFDNSANMGLDSSGQSNNLTTTGTVIQNKDTPSNVFATMNVLSGDHDEVTTTNGNLTLLGTTQTNAMASTLGVSQGKYYWEAKINGSNTQQIGIIEVGKEGTLNDVSAGGSGKNGYVLLSNGDIYNNGSVVDTGSSFTTNDIIGVALDLDTNYIYFYKNGTLTNSGGTSIVNRLYFAVSSAGGGSDLISASYNFGNGYFGATAVSSAQNPTDGVGIFEYTPPTNYRALCTKSINAQEYS